MSDKGVAAVYILDSFALLAYLQGEIGGDQVQEVLYPGSPGKLPGVVSFDQFGRDGVYH